MPQEARDAASLAAAQQAFTVRDAAIHAIADANPKLAGCALAIVASGRIAIVESLLNAWPLGDDLDAFDRWRARGVSIVGFVHAGNDQFADSHACGCAAARPELRNSNQRDRVEGRKAAGASRSVSPG